MATLGVHAGAGAIQGPRSGGRARAGGRRGRSRGSGRGRGAHRQLSASAANGSSSDSPMEDAQQGPAKKTVATRGVAKPGGYREGSDDSAQDASSGAED